MTILSYGYEGVWVRGSTEVLLCIVYVQTVETPPPSPSLMPTIKGSNENQVVTRRRKGVDVEGEDDSQVPSER